MAKTKSSLGLFSSDSKILVVDKVTFKDCDLMIKIALISAWFFLGLFILNTVLGFII